MSAAAGELAVDRDRCVGAGQCVLTAPEAFTQGVDDGKVLLLPGPGVDAEQARAVALLCPSGALRVPGEIGP